MGRRLFDHFNEKFDKYLSSGLSKSDAFNKTNEELGFDAYSCYTSFAVIRGRIHRNERGKNRKR